MQHIGTYVIGSKILRRKCNHCKKNLAMIRMACPECGTVDWCEECIRRHLADIHMERDAYIDLLNHAIKSALSSEEEKEQFIEIAQKAKLEANVASTLSRRMLINLHDVVGKISDAAIAARNNNHLIVAESTDGSNSDHELYR